MNAALGRLLCRLHLHAFSATVLGPGMLCHVCTRCGAIAGGGLQ